MRRKRHNNPFTRGKPTRAQYKKNLIVCEGECTEPIYFKPFLNKLRYPKNLFIVKCVNANPLGIVTEACKTKDQLDDIDNAWCVFDCDVEDGLNDAILKANSNDIRLAISNPCFELWYLLHFLDQTANIKTSQTISKLKKFIPKYSKKFDCSTTLQIHLNDAIQRAKELCAIHKRNQLDKYENPVTYVFELVEYLLNLPPYRSR